MTEQEYIAMVRDNPWIVKKIPARNLTEKICLAAVEGEPSLFADIPVEFYTPLIIKTALHGEGENLYFLAQRIQWGDLDEEALTEDWCHTAVTGKNPGHAISYVPRALITQDFCKQAITANPYAWDSVPDSFKTPALKRLADKKVAELEKQRKASERDAQRLARLKKAPPPSKTAVASKRKLPLAKLTNYIGGSKPAVRLLKRLESEGKLVNVYSRACFPADRSDSVFCTESLEDLDRDYGTSYRGHLLIIYVSRYDTVLADELESLYPPLGSVGRFSQSYFLLLNLNCQKLLRLGIGRKKSVFCIDAVSELPIDIHSKKPKVYVESFLTLDRGSFTSWILEQLDLVSIALVDHEYNGQGHDDPRQVDIDLEDAMAGINTLFPQVEVIDEGFE